jgi:hypothetical protein
MIHGMKYPKTWGAIANHSGDAYFDFVYWHDWPNTLNELAKYRVPKRKAGVYDARREARRKGLAAGLDDGRIKRFLAHGWKKEKLSGKEVHCLMNLCMAATYDPDARAPNGFRIPFNAETGEVIGGKLTLHFLPGYAPDLNPDELVWSHAKRTGVARSPLRAGEKLQCRVDDQLQAIANDSALVRSFFRHPSVSYISDL